MTHFEIQLGLYAKIKLIFETLILKLEYYEEQIR